LIIARPNQRLVGRESIGWAPAPIRSWCCLLNQPRAFSLFANSSSSLTSCRPGPGCNPGSKRPCPYEYVPAVLLRNDPRPHAAGHLKLASPGKYPIPSTFGEPSLGVIAPGLCQQPFGVVGRQEIKYWSPRFRRQCAPGTWTQAASSDAATFRIAQGLGALFWAATRAQCSLWPLGSLLRDCNRGIAVSSNPAVASRKNDSLDCHDFPRC
jgi:hypothetical protein